MSTTFTIDLDVSRALAAQQKMIDKMDDIGRAGNRIVSGVEPVKQQFETIGRSLEGVNKALGAISSGSKLNSQIADLKEINNQIDRLRNFNKMTFGDISDKSFKAITASVVELNEKLKVMDNAYNAIASQLRSLPKHKFDFSSVEDYRLKLSHLGQELAALKSFKVSMDPIDYSKMENSLTAAINEFKQKFRNYTGSKDPYGMIEAFDRTYAGIIEKTSGLSQKIKDSLNVTTSGSISHKSVADSMGFGDDLTNRITAVTNHVEAEAKRLGQALRVSITGGGTPSNNTNSLINSSTKNYGTTLTNYGFSEAEERKAGLRFDSSYSDGVVKAMRDIDAAGAKVKTSVDASAQAYINWKTSIVDATRARTSFYDGMTSGLTKWQQENAAIKEHIALMNRLSSYVDRSSQYTMMGYAGAKTPNSSNIQSSLNNISSANIAGVSKELDNAANASGKVSEKLNGLGLVIKRVFEYGMVYRFQNAILSIPGAIWDANLKMEMMSATFKGAFGEEAVTMINYVKEAASRYGIELISLGESYKKFAVTMDQLGVDGKLTNMIFESTTEALKKAGASSGDTANAFRALIQMYSKGTVSAEEFTRQLSQYIPAANSLAAKSLGVTTAEFKKLLATGQLIPEQFIPEFSKQMKIFGMGWEEAANTMEANVSRMKNAWLEMADSKAFQNMASSAVNAGTTIIKFTDTVVNSFNMIKNGDMNLSTLLFGAPGEAQKHISDFNARMSDLDTKIDYTKKKLASMAEPNSSIIPTPVTAIFGDRYADEYNVTKADLASAEKEKWAGQLKTSLKSVTDDYLKLQRLFKEGDFSVKGDMDYDKEKMIWIVDVLSKVSSFDGKKFLAAIDIDTDSIKAAIALVDRLFAKTREGKVDAADAAVTKYETIGKGFEKELTNLMNNGSGTATLNRIDELNRAIKENDIITKEAKENLLSLIKTAADKEVKQLGDGIFTGNNSGKSKEAQILAAKKDFNDKYKKLLAEYNESQTTANGKMSSARFAEIEKKGLDELEGKIALINKQGGDGRKEERHANAVDKLTSSLDNLLRKEMGLAEESPLTAAFAAADEKLNSLMKNIKNLALDGGFDIEEATNKAKDLHTELLKVATDKQLENIFPWLKKDDAIKAIADTIHKFYSGTKEESQVVADSLAKEGLVITDLTERLEKLTKLEPGVRALAEAQRKLAEASSFGEYADAAKQVDTIENSPGNNGEKEAIREFYETYITLTKGMTESRLEMYRRVAEQAKAYGMSEGQVAALVQSKWEEAEVQRLGAIQKYGSASEAFAARLAQNFETYKDGATKSREYAVKMADSITNMADSLSSGIGQAFGDMIRNIGNGTASIEDLWKNMLARMLDMFASFVEELIKDKLKDLIGGLFSDSSSSGGGLNVSKLLGGSSSSSSSSSDGVFSVSNLNRIGNVFGDKTTSALQEYMPVEDGALSVNFDDIPDVGKEFAKSVTKYSEQYGTYGSYAVKDIESIAPTLTNSLKTATTSGWKDALGGIGGGMAIGTGIGTAIGGDQMASTIGSAVGSVAGAAIGMAFGVPMVGGLIGGAIGGAGGGLFSSGSQKEEKKKTASGYNVGYANGHATAYGVDFYNTGVEYSGPSNPDVQRKIADSFRNTAEALQDFAEELGFAVDVLEGFQMPNMNVTDDQLDGYIRNGENMMAFKGLMEVGLRGAFDAVARDGEVYVDEYERLATSLSTVRGGLEAYGYELSDVAMITQDNIDTLRVKNTEVAEGTAQAMAAMASSMGASSEWVAQVASDTTAATAALKVTDEQLSSILEADYASDLLDAVGGEEAFNAMMGNLTKNVFDTIEAYAENLDYYNAKATSAIGKLNEAGVTVDNFWEKFDAAIKEGLTVDEFEAWGKASTWVNQIDSVTQAMEDWADAMENASQSLDVRKLKALGQDEAASVLDTVYKQEQELAQARKDGYDAAVLLQLEEVQLLELRRAEAEMARKGWEVIEDLNVREKELNNDPFAEAARAYYDNGWELKEAMESGLYSKGDLARLADIQTREIQAYYDEIAESIKEQVSSITDQLDATRLSDVAQWLNDLKDSVADASKEASRLGASEEQLAAIRSAEIDIIKAKLRDVMTSVTDQLYDATRGDTFNWLEELRATMKEAAEDAKLLGASEQQLLLIRLSEMDIIKAKLNETLETLYDGFNSELLSDTQNWVTGYRKDINDSIRDARLLGATEKELAAIRANEAAVVAKRLAEVLDSVTNSYNSEMRNDTETWYASLHDSMQEAIADAQALGASESQLATIRQQHTDIIAHKLSEMMSGIVTELSQFDGTELSRAISNMKNDMAEAMYEAAILGASESDLNQIGNLYAYKVKDQYQQRIDEIISQLEPIADALKDFSESLKDFIDELWTNESTSPLDPAETYEVLQARWYQTLADLSSTDDETKSNAQGKIQSLSTEYLEASKNRTGSYEAYYADFWEVQNKLKDQYRIAKSEYEILNEALEKAKGTEENTKTTAELIEELNSLQEEQLTTWNQMISSLPTIIADAIIKAEEYKASMKKAAAAAVAGGGAASSVDDVNRSFGDWYARSQATNTKYLNDKAAQMTKETGTTWTTNMVLESFREAGIFSNYDHYLQYGKNEGLTWDGDTTGPGFDLQQQALGEDSQYSPVFDPADYLAGKVEQLERDTGEHWTAQQVADAIRDAGMSLRDHYDTYGRYEDIPGFASGGYIPGYSSQDTLLAKLRLGEYVMTPETVNHYGVDFMDAINSMSIQGFSEGGSTGRLDTPVFFSGNSQSDNSEDLKKEIAALRKDLNTAMGELVSTSKKTTKTLRGWTETGMPTAPATSE